MTRPDHDRCRHCDQPVYGQHRTAGAHPCCVYWAGRGARGCPACAISAGAGEAHARRRRDAAQEALARSRGRLRANRQDPALKAAVTAAQAALREAETRLSQETNRRTALCA